MLENFDLIPAPLTKDLNTKVQRCKFLSLTLLDFCDIDQLSCIFCNFFTECQQTALNHTLI